MPARKPRAVPVLNLVATQTLRSEKPPGRQSLEAGDATLSRQRTSCDGALFHRVFHAVASPPAPAPAQPTAFLNETVSFEQLGMNEELCRAVAKCGFQHPASTQALGIPTILQGSNTILAAETGSGKTLAYLLPIIQSVRDRCEQLRADRPDAPEWFSHCALVLCPNVDLCKQVIAVAHSLRDATDAPLTRAAFVSSSSPPPRTPVDIIVSTPGALDTLLTEFGSAFGRAWSPEGLAQRVRHIVADEADAMVVSDSYWQPMCRLLDLMRAADRTFAGKAVSAQAGITEVEFTELRRHERMAAFKGGMPGLLETGWDAATHGLGTKSADTASGSKAAGAPSETDAAWNADPSADDSVGVDINDAATASSSDTGRAAVDSDAAWNSVSAGAEAMTEAETSTSNSEAEAEMSTLKTSETSQIADVSAAQDSGAAAAPSTEEGRAVPRDLIVGAPHRCRSYIFIGATMPREGGKSVAADLRKRFPDMEWLQGNQLHRSKVGVEHSWVALDAADDVVPAVTTALRHESDQRQGMGQTLVFCRDARSADDMHAALTEVGIRAVTFHKKVPPATREENLRQLQAEDGCVLVCTDAASRGLDFGSVGHVVQADFAADAVKFLHRIGRTGRAGRAGKVTSFYLPDRADLAQAIRASIESGEPVEGAFSRNRSFSHKMKKHGRFVPRGQSA